MSKSEMQTIRIIPSSAMCHTVSGIGKFCPDLVATFGEVVEPLWHNV